MLQMKKRVSILQFALLVAVWAGFAAGEGAAVGGEIDVDAAEVKNSCSPWLYGACIEDVNHEIYGGLYAQRLYGESFEEPRSIDTIKGWSTYGGQWRPAGSGVTVAADQGGKLVCQRPPFADGSVEWDLRFDAPGASSANAGIIVRVGSAAVGADAFDGYEISLAADGRSLVFGRHRQNWVPLQRAPVSVDPTRWQHLRVTLAEKHIQIYLNGNPSAVIDYTDDDPLPAGNVGLRTWGADAQFNNFRWTIAGGQSSNVAFAAAPSDEVSAMWDTVQTDSARAEYALDKTLPFNGSQSQRIQFLGGSGAVGVANRGLGRWGVPVQKGRVMTGRVYLRSEGSHAPVTVSLQNLDGSQTYASRTLADVPKVWTKFGFDLTPDADDPNARFVVTLDAPDTLWIDQAVLMDGSDNRFYDLPVRADIANAMVAGKLSFLRYGGTAVNVPGYRWKSMVGDPDRRPPYQGNWHPYTSNGFGIEDFLAFCEKARITPAFAVNVEETPQDMADMVEYLNGGENTKQGQLRAANGHPAPYGVKYIELGNEEVIWGDIAADYDHYVERFKLLAAAMKRVDPNLVLVNAAWWRGDNRNCERVFKALDGLADYWDFHFWADDADSGRKTDRELEQARELFQRWVPGAKMKVVIFEENGNRHDLQRALGHATTLNAVRRHGDFVSIDCEANGLQPWRQNDNGWDQGHIFFTPDHVWGMPPYYAQRMASLNHEPLLVGSRVIDDPNLDVTATRSTDGRTLCLHVVNLAATASDTRLKVSGLPGIKPLAEAWMLMGDLKGVNTPDKPTAVQTTVQKVSNAGSNFQYAFPAHSYTILRLDAVSALDQP